jgi:tRNA pseudouridine38-40 synthase
LGSGAEPSLRHFLLTVAYDGGEFHGWQRQRGDRSVQGEIEAVLARLVGGRVVLRGAGRTDAGVHALGQLAAFSATTRMGAGDFRRALNALLPDSVRVAAAVETEAPVDPRRGARRKTYVYQFHLGDHLPPDRRRHFVLAGAALDVAAMRRAAAHLRGVHDFSSFARSSAARRGAIRRIDAVRVRRMSRGVRLFVTGSGFLYNMVRTLASALLEVGRGRCGPDEVAVLLAARDRRRGPATLPPQGLFLWRVDLGRGGSERTGRRDATIGGSTDPRDERIPLG